MDKTLIVIICLICAAIIGILDCIVTNSIYADILYEILEKSVKKEINK